MSSLYSLNKILVSLFLVVCFNATSFAQTTQRKGVYLPYQDAQPVLQALKQILPVEFATQDPNNWSKVWSAWVLQSDKSIRSRLAQGDEDSLVNFLLFGATFTKQPRVTQRQIEEINKQAQATGNIAAAQARINEIMQARLDDFIKALAQPNKNERLLFAQQMLVTNKSYQLNTEEGKNVIRQEMLKMLGRVLVEAENYNRILQQAKLLGDSTAEFAERSKLYSARGLSSDTSLRPNFAIEESLKALKAKGIVKEIKRVAIVGPGLDFTDKQEGYDFYPQQTIQPFAVIDSLLRLGLSKENSLQITTLDLSPKVNDHIARTKANSQRGTAYTIQLPLDTQEKWKPDFLRYWEKFGDQIGMPTPPVQVPANAGDLKIRAVKVRAPFGAKITPTDVNIVLQRLELPATEKFDLIIGTNIFVYYNDLEQSLAMVNLEKMLAPGGILLSNNAMLELPSAKVKSISSTTVVYSDKPNDGDIIVWYQRQQN